MARDPQDWLVRQLKGSPPVLTGEGLKPSAETLAKVIELRRQNERTRREKKKRRRRRQPGGHGTQAAGRLPAGVRRRGLCTLLALDRHRAALPRAAHAVLDQPLRGLHRQDRGAGPRGRHGARGHPASRNRTLHRFVVSRREASRDAAVSRQPGVHRSELQSGAVRRQAWQRAQGGHQRKSGARNPRAAHAGRRRRLHAVGCDHFCAGHLRLVDRGPGQAAGWRGSASTTARRENSTSARFSTSPAPSGC